MSKAHLVVAAAATILAASVLLDLELSNRQPATVPPTDQAFETNLVSTCPPRPTRIPPPVATPRLTPPTPAPTPTPGLPQPVRTAAPDATLSHPLESEQEILTVVLDMDINNADWDDPWCLETPRLEPGRISIQWYQSMTSYDGSRSYDSRDEDPFWVVTIRGAVRLPMPGAGPGKRGGVIYFVNQTTGKIYRIGALPPL